MPMTQQQAIGLVIQLETLLHGEILGVGMAGSQGALSKAHCERARAGLRDAAPLMYPVVIRELEWRVARVEQWLSLHGDRGEPSC
jgi:hypothetical protein